MTGIDNFDDPRVRSLKKNDSLEPKANAASQDSKDLKLNKERKVFSNSVTGRNVSYSRTLLGG